MKDTFRAKFQIFNLTSPIALLKKNVYLLIYIYKNELLPEQYIYRDAQGNNDFLF